MSPPQLLTLTRLPQKLPSRSVPAFAGAFSGALSVGGQASSKRTTTTISGGSQISQAQADRLYLERIEDEYAKREGGA
jgi:hypothetical protein